MPDINDLVAKAAELLSKHGTVNVPSTGSHQDYGADLFFSPSTGPHAKALFVIDFKAGHAGEYLPSAAIASTASQLAHLMDEPDERPIYTVLATNLRVAPTVMTTKLPSRLLFLQQVTTPEMLAEGVKSLANRPEPLSPSSGG